MKLPPAWLLSVLLTGNPAFAQEESIPSPAPAQIIGEVADGRVSETTEPAFVVPAADILETKSVAQGGRTITIQRIKPLDLPEPQTAVPSAQQPAVRRQVAESGEEQPESELLYVVATVFHSTDSGTRSLVQIDPQGKGRPVAFWSSADFAYLSGFTSFAGGDGTARNLILSWSPREIGAMGGFIAAHGGEYGVSSVPELPAGQAAFSVVSPNPAPEALAAIQALHDLYNAEHDRLKAAYEGREQARLAREAELRAHPPQPKDITLSFWRTEGPAPAANGKGAVR